MYEPNTDGIEFSLENLATCEWDVSKVAGIMLTLGHKIASEANQILWSRTDSGRFAAFMDFSDTWTRRAYDVLRQREDALREQARQEWNDRMRADLGASVN